MMKRLRVCVVWGVLVGLGALAFATDVSAADGYSYGGIGYPYYCGFPILRGEDRDIPYYAAHPPVYYSHIVARPYGYSPYPYVPGVVTPDFELSSPWHPAQPFQPYWDGEGWRWRARGSSGEADKSGRPAAKPALRTTRTSPEPRPMTIENSYLAGLDPDRPHNGTAPLRIKNPYVADRFDRNGGDANAVVVVGKN